jgi:hypothetical protein
MNETNRMPKNEEELALQEAECSELQAIVGGYDPNNWCGTHPPQWHPPPVAHQ